MTATIPAYGEVFTRRWVVDLILDLVEYTPDRPLHEKVIVEPSVGSGAFVGPIVERLIAAKPKRSRWSDLSGALRGFDLQPQHVLTCRSLASRLLTEAGCPPEQARSLAQEWLHVGDFLLSTKADLFTDTQGLVADWVVGNPPYIRIEDLPGHLLREYRRVAPTMMGRADIFIGFYEHGLDLLKPDGRLAYICADRWMRNSYGKALRQKVLREGFAVDDVIVMHDAPAFEAEVSAYPAVTVLRRGPERGTITATATGAIDESESRRLREWRSGALPALRTSAVRAARMERWHTTDVWPDGTPETLAWLAHLTATLPLIEDGSGATRIGIGIATGADSVYLPSQAPDVEPGQLVPMVMGADIKTGTFAWTGRRLVSPWNSHGPVDLAEHSKLRSYYERHLPALKGRNVAGRTPYWYCSATTCSSWRT